MPVGVVAQVERARPKDLAVSPDRRMVAVLAQNKVLLYGATDGAPIAEVSIGAAAPLGIAWAPDGRTVYASLAGGKVARIISDDTGAKWVRKDEIVVDTVKADGEPDVAAGLAGRGRSQGDPQVNGLTVSPDGDRLYVALGIRNAVAVIDTAQNKVIRSVSVAVAPYHVALSADGKTLAVSCRGGKVADGKELSAPSAGSAVRVEKETDAALSGAVTFLDTDTMVARIASVGRQPGGMAFAPDGKTIYVASEDDDSLYALSLSEGKAIKTYRLQTDNDPGFGKIPNSVAVSDDGKRLFVACGGINAVAILEADSGKVQGYIPAGWFPIAVRQVGGNLIVASSKGLGGRVPRAEKKETSEKKSAPAYGVHSTLGLVQFVAPSVWADLPTLTETVAKNNLWGMAAKSEAPRKNVSPVPVPERVGEPSVFQHVVYIIKENHTYDDDLGDMKEGNGDPSLCLFGETVTPNAHALAREFVLLDNTYTSGTNSADGHQWTVSGVANGYLEHNYAAHARSYPYDGGDPLAYSPRGFLWTSAVRAKKSVRVYGEFVNKPKIVNNETGRGGATWTDLWNDYKNKTNKFTITSDTDNAALKPYLHPNYIGFPNTVSDQWRADQYLADLTEWEKTGRMPNLSILLLPNDHTAGTRPGVPTPRAMTADGDLALGRIVDRLSHSRFWKNTLILVIEDDSQMGLDHVDGHRTVAFCISPYTRRHAVVSDVYNHTSFLRTIGLVLGLEPMNRFDRTATPMRACFTPTADRTPYTARPNGIPLDEMNPPASALNGEARRHAIASADLDLSDVDRADMGVLTRAVWYAQKPKTPFPASRYKPPVDDDD
jgi:YVTN family beta-propeller protein